MVATASCPKCGYKNELPACDNCGSVSFRKGNLSDGSHGMICEKCNLGRSHMPCQGGCGTQIATSTLGTPTSRLAERALEGMKAADGGSCFIATEIYGIDSREVAALRRVRDRILLPNPLGRRFVALYYRAAPSVIPLMRRTAFVRLPIRKLVSFCVFVANKI
jgi:hypothetical protein